VRSSRWNLLNSTGDERSTPKRRVSSREEVCAAACRWGTGIDRTKVCKEQWDGKHFLSITEPSLPAKEIARGCEQLMDKHSKPLKMY